MVHPSNNPRIAMRPNAHDERCDSWQKIACAGDRCRPDSTSTAGFTLVELIASVAILLILVVIGMFSANSFLEASRKATCTNNLKQIYAATMMFVEDNNGYLPNGRGKNPYDGNDESNQNVDVTFIERLWPYVYPDKRWTSLPQPVFGNGSAFNELPVAFRNTVFECPGARDDPPQISIKRSYAINQQLGDGNFYTHDRMIRIPSLSKVAFIGDSKNASKLSVETINTRHRGTCNILYLDGHVEAFVAPKNLSASDPLWGKEQ
jgi:prepilin-type processing-associated H-X9-DG protein/prepilin-type N-terminal cleavage/methylation domain-containing protein